SFYSLVYDSPKFFWFLLPPPITLRAPDARLWGLSRSLFLVFLWVFVLFCLSRAFVGVVSSFYSPSPSRCLVWCFRCGRLGGSRPDVRPGWCTCAFSCPAYAGLSGDTCNRSPPARH